MVPTPGVLKKEPKIICYTEYELSVLVFICVLQFILTSMFFNKVFALILSLLIFVSVTTAKILSSKELGLLHFFYGIIALLKGNKKVIKEFGGKISNLKFISESIINVDGKNIMILEIYPVNFLYASQETQRSILDSYRKFLNSLDFPVQILCLSYEFSANKYINKLILRSEDDDILSNRFLKDVVDDYIFWLNLNIENTYMRRYFVIVAVDDKKSNSISELNRRVNLIKSMLLSANIKCEIISEREILNLYNIINNRKSIIEKYY